MKKALHKLFTYSLILAPIVLFSCQKKRNWICTCEVTGNNFGTFKKEINHQTQRKATDECGAYGKELMGSGGNYNCSLIGDE